MTPIPLPLAAATPRRASTVWIPATLVAELLGISREQVLPRGKTEGWRMRVVSRGDSRGTRREVDLDSLPESLQATAVTRLGSEAQGSAGAEAKGSNGAGERDARTGLTAAEMWESARDGDRETAIARKATLEAWEAYCAANAAGRRNRTALTADYVAHWNAVHQDEPMSASTLARWARRSRERGITGLLPEYAVGPKGHDVPKEIGDLVGKYYLDRSQKQLTVCYEIARVECARLYPTLLDAFPSLGTIRRYVRARWPRQTIILAREGGSAFRQKCLPYIEMDPTKVAVMDLWTSDNRVHDIWCANLDGDRVRPWVTDWRDKRSTFRVGWLIHEGPTSETALASFAMAVRRYGFPRALQLDNDRIYATPEFAGKSRRWKVHYDEPRVRGLLEHLTWIEDGETQRVEVHFTIPREPRGKGSHETQYRHQDAEWFDKLWPAYCGKDPNSRPEHLQHLRRRKDGLPTLAEVQYLYGIHAAGINHKPSEAQDLAGRTPAEAFAAAEYVRRTAPEGALRILMMKPSRDLLVEKNGVWLFDRWYWSETLARHLGARVYVRYDLDEIGRLLAFTLQDQYLDTLERVEMLSRHASAEDARKAFHRKKFVRSIARQAAEVRDHTAANPDIIAGIAEARQARYLAEGKPTPQPDRPRKVSQAIQTPFDAAARQIGSRDATRAERATLDREAREMRRIIREARAPEADTPAADLEAEAMALRRQLKIASSSSD